jgi:hypothetical protein
MTGNHGSSRFDQQLLSRRQVSLGALAGGALLAIGRLDHSAGAQATDLTHLGYPTLDVVITADGFSGIPETLAAGRYLLNATAEGLEEGGAIAFLSPYGMSAEEFFAFLAGGAPPASPEASGSPAAEGGGEIEGPLPTFVYQSKFAGGVLAAPGLPGTAVIDLTEGEWIAWGDDPTSSQAPVVIRVTGEFPTDVEEPDADLMFTLVDFGIMIDGNLVAGEHVLRIENLGAQPHFVDLEKVPEGTTNEELAALLGAIMTGGTPVAGGLTEDDFQPVLFTPTQSIGTTTWTKASLDAGTYAAVCWFATAGIGDPHAVHGMHTIFDVTEA